MCYYFKILAVLLVLLTAGGCTNSDTVSQSLVLSLVKQGSDFRVVDYQVLDTPYKHSPRQGSYRVHLLDKKFNIIRKIGFDKLNIPDSAKREEKAGTELVIPLKPELHQIIIYRLDVSSGHYRLIKDDPLLTWKLTDTTETKKRKFEHSR